MEEVVQRLRASKAQAQKRAAAVAYKAGRRWASTTASYEQLAAVEASWDPAHGWGFGYPCSVYGDGELFHSILTRERPDRPASAEFWERTLGPRWRRDLDRSGFVQAFTEGAMSVWDAVKANV